MTDPAPKSLPSSKRARQKFPPVPWGLLLALAGYAALVTGYLQATYWSSPEYQAIEHYDSAWRILGPAEGRSCTADELATAYEHLLEAARLVPQVTRIHQQLERLNWRFDERHLPMPPELRNRANAVAVVWRRIQEERAPILVVGARDHGWAPDQLRDGPGRTLGWSMVGVVIILGAWAYLRFNRRQVSELERDRELTEMEREVRALAGHRADTDAEARSARPEVIGPAGATRRRRPAPRK